MTAGKNSMQRVIILRRDRIKFVIVASSAGNGQTERSASDHVDAIIDNVVLVIEKTPPQRQETQCGKRMPVFSCTHLVGRNLLDQKLIVRFVVVESPHYIVAIRVGEGIATLLSTCQISFRVGVACH